MSRADKLRIHIARVEHLLNRRAFLFAVEEKLARQLLAIFTRQLEEEEGNQARAMELRAWFEFQLEL